MSDQPNILLTLLYGGAGGYGAKLFFETFAKNQINDFLLFLSKNTNLPSNVQIKLGENSATDRYFGLVELHFSSSMTIDQVKQCLYEVYCICRAEGLTIKGKNTILVSNTFSESSITSSQVFFNRAGEKWLDGFKIQPYGKVFSPVYSENFLDVEKVNLEQLIGSFQSICSNRITGSQAYLFLICSGVIIGGSFDYDVLNDCVAIASKMTLKNEKLVGFSQQKKARLFLQIVKFLFCEAEKRNLFEIEFVRELKLGKTEFDKVTVFDIEKFVCQKLNDYYQFGVNFDDN